MKQEEKIDFLATALSSADISFGPTRIDEQDWIYFSYNNMAERILEFLQKLNIDLCDLQEKKDDLGKGA